MITGGMLTSSKSREHYAKVLAQAPLGFFIPSTETFRLIPASFRPLILEDDLWMRTVSDCRHVLVALKKISAWLRKEGKDGLAGRLFGAFGVLEQEAAWGRLGSHDELATVRFDFFFEGDDLRVLEVNSTIPAMQAYSDMVRQAYSEALALERMSLPLTKRSNGSDLLLSLCRHYQLTGAKKLHPRIGIIARSGDSQIAELRWLQTAWQRDGHEVILGTPEDVTLKAGVVHIREIPVDLVYRHIFAYRLDPKSAFAEACRHSHQYRVFNSISAHLEAKGVLAEMSRVADDEQLSEAALLTSEEIEAVRRRVPWSRVVRPRHDIGPSGEHLDDLLTFLKSAGRRNIVLKSSLGYGGHGVIIGADFETVETQSRVQALMSISQHVTWESFVDFCSRPGGDLWVAQRLIQGKKWQHDYFTDGVVKKDENDFIDCSLFGGMFDEMTVPGGAVRFSRDQIVNLGRGGGLAPFMLKSETTFL